MYQVLSDTLNQKEIDKVAFREKDFAHIFEIYYKRVYNFIYYRVNNNSIAEDLTSQTFERYMVKIDTYIETKSPFEVWLFAIAKNMINDYFRSLKRVQIISIDSIKDLISTREGPEDIAEASENIDEVLVALNVLKPRERDILALKFGANLSNKDIAEILEVSDSNVGVILYRAMKKLKRELERREKVYE